MNISLSWGLSKCAVIRFGPQNCPLPFTGSSPYSLDGNHIKFVSFHYDIGVTVDQPRKFHCHIRDKVKAANSRSKNLLCIHFMLQTIVSDEPLHHSCKTFITDYAFLLWHTAPGYADDMKLLERNQRRWTGAVTG